MRHIPYSLFILAITADLASAQATSYSTPVGYITVDVPANADTTFSPGMTLEPLLIAASTSISGDDVGVSGLTAGAFVSPACYLKVSSGTLEGMIFPITANTTSIITVDAGASDLQTLGFQTGDTFQVIPFWTLDTLFPNGEGIGGTADALNPTSFVFVSDYNGTGINRATSASYFYCTGDAELGIAAGWYDSNDPFSPSVGGNPLDPTILYTIRSAGTPSSIVVNGSIPTVRHHAEVIEIVGANDNYLASPFPVDVSLQDSGLQSVVTGTSDALNPIDQVYVFDDAAVGINKGVSGAYFYCTGDAELGISAGWYDSNDPFAGEVTSKVLKAGRCFIIRKASAASPDALDWIAQVPYSLP